MVPYLTVQDKTETTVTHTLLIPLLPRVLVTYMFGYCHIKYARCTHLSQIIFSANPKISLYFDVIGGKQNNWPSHLTNHNDLISDKQIRQLMHLHKFAFIMMRARGNNFILLSVKRKMSLANPDTICIHSYMQIKATSSAPCRVRRGFEWQCNRIFVRLMLRRLCHS